MMEKTTAEKENGKMFYEDPLVAAYMAREGIAVFGLEGISGIGKTELCSTFAEVAQQQQFHPVVLELGNYLTEDALIAGLFVKTRALNAVTTALQVQDARKEVATFLISAIPQLASGLFKDLVDKVGLENTTDAIAELIADPEKKDGVENHLKEMDDNNRRIFITEFLKALGARGIKLIIVLDDFHRIEPQCENYIQHLINNKPSTWAICVTCNPEVGSEYWRTRLRSHILVKRGFVQSLSGMDRDGIREWYVAETGTTPSPAEIDAILKWSGGRAVEVQAYIEAVKSGKPPTKGDYSGIIQDKIDALSPQARRLVELVAPIKPDTGLPLDWLKLAVKRYNGITSFSDALRELESHDFLKTHGHNVQFRHSTWQEECQKRITAHQQDEEIREVWLNVMQEIDGIQNMTGAHLPLVAFLIPAMQVLLSAQEITALAEKLAFDIGAPNESLALLRSSWDDKQGEQNDER